MSEEREYGSPTPIYEYLTPESSDGTEGWVIFADPDADGRSVADYRLCLVPSKHGDKFTIFRCTEESYIPDEAALVMPKEANTILYGDYRYNCMNCWMITSNATDQFPSTHLITFPEEMQNKRLPVTECPDKDLLNLLLTSAVEFDQIEQSTDRGMIGRIKSFFM